VETRGQLADGGSLARTVHAYHQDHRRRLGNARRSALARSQNVQKLFANQPAQLGGVVQLVPLHAPPDVVQYFGGGARAHIGGDQGEFQLLQQVGVDFPLAFERVFQSRNQARARLLHAGLQFFEQRRFLLHRAEQGLDHFDIILAGAGKITFGAGYRWAQERFRLGDGG